MFSVNFIHIERNRLPPHNLVASTYQRDNQRICKLVGYKVTRVELHLEPANEPLPCMGANNVLHWPSR